MSSCLSGGGQAYGFDLEIVKPPSPSTYSSHSSSPSSTISESSNSPLAISTRKPRTPRKRPNQTYTEAAALLSTISPSIFSTKHLQKPCKHVKSYDSFSESSELLPPFPAFDNPGFLLHQPIPEKPTFRIAPRPANSGEKSCHGSSDIDFRPNSPARCDGYEEDFDAGLILDEVDEGIDSIMGNLSMCNESYSDSNDYSGQTNDWCGNPMGLGFGGRFEVGVGFGGNVRALRHVEDEDWWRNPTVEVINILPKFKSSEKKKKKKKVEEDELKDLKSGLCLKLNYEDVLSGWSDRSPFSDQISTATGSTADAIARLTQCDLLSGIGGWKQHQGDEIDGQREACVLRYKEKRRTRLFSKKIRYQVRKVNADRRPRMKGRFVRRPSLLHLSNGEG